MIDAVDKEKDNIVKLLQDLLRIPSVTGDELEIQKFISSYLRQVGINTKMWEPDLEELKKHPGYVPVEVGYKNRPNVAGILKGEGGGRSLILNGHVDVIPSGPREAWSVDPWGGKIIGDSIYGRGASDMKSGIAAMTAAAMIFSKNGIKLNGDLTLEYTVDEELSGNGTLDFVIKGYKADGGISLETSSLKVQPACIGRIWFETTINGKAAGIQNRRAGVNAIDLGYKIKGAVDSYEALRISTLNHALFPDKVEALACIIGEFKSGSYPSAFPDTCVLRGSIATLPNEDSNKVKADFKRYIEEFAKEDPWMRDHQPEIKYKGYFAEPSEISPEHPLVKTLSNAYTSITNSNPVISGRTGAADIRFLNKYGNTPSLIFGPGDTLQMHATNEHVKIESLLTATKILVKTIGEWCGIKD
ncbi:MAG: ArgE/DapE family deacylase [Candidatus Micrarchaeaceae archaeon]